MLTVIMLNVVMLSAIVLNVVALPNVTGSFWLGSNGIGNTQNRIK
jgi:hypothetical protein